MPSCATIPSAAPRRRGARRAPSRASIEQSGRTAIGSGVGGSAANGFQPRHCAAARPWARSARCHLAPQFHPPRRRGARRAPVCRGVRPHGVRPLAHQSNGPAGPRSKAASAEALPTVSNHVIAPPCDRGRVAQDGILRHNSIRRAVGAHGVRPCATACAHAPQFHPPRCVVGAHGVRPLAHQSNSPAGPRSKAASAETTPAISNRIIAPPRGRGRVAQDAILRHNSIRRAGP
jgi:hypothetical protein